MPGPGNYTDKRQTHGRKAYRFYLILTFLRDTGVFLAKKRRAKEVDRPESFHTNSTKNNTVWRCANMKGKDVWAGAVNNGKLTRRT